MKEVRTRFAPSPTGFQHIGGFRTAMYAWLYARHNQGKFLLRIEDTDQERLVPGAVRYILESMQWLGMDIDEGPSAEDLKAINEHCEGVSHPGGAFGPYVQSLRKDIYKKYVDLLIEKGAAYRCDCTPEMLEKERAEQTARKENPGYSGYCRTRKVPADVKHVVRFKIPANVSLTLMDAVRGRVTWDAPSLKDTVLLKSDGMPTYHLASVVDDHLMEISHVMRGEEWLATTPIHLMLYEAFGWEAPVFCHLSQVLGRDGKKLSKRHGADSLNELKEKGFLPEAILNYVVLVGWSPGEGEAQEVFTRDELIAKFSLDHLSCAGGIFDADKLLWMNGVYLRSMPVERFTELAVPFIEKAGLKFDPARWGIIAPCVKERMKLLTEVPGAVDFLFVDKIQQDSAGLLKHGGSAEKVKEVLGLAYEGLGGVPDFSVPEIEKAMAAVVEKTGLKVGAVYGVVRLAITGKKVTPPLFESIAALGKDEALRRMQEGMGAV